MENITKLSSLVEGESKVTHYNLNNNFGRFHSRALQVALLLCCFILSVLSTEMYPQTKGPKLYLAAFSDKFALCKPDSSVLLIVHAPNKPLTIVNEMQILQSRKVSSTDYEVKLGPGEQALSFESRSLGKLQLPSMHFSPSRVYELTLKSCVPVDAQGYLNVSCNAGDAKVFVDDSISGTGTIKDLKLAGGEHRLRIEAVGFAAYQGIVAISGGETTSYAVFLPSEDATLMLTTPNEPGADIFLNGKKVGSSPFVSSAVLAGKYQLKVSKWPYRDIVQQITLSGGDTLQKEIFFGSDFAQLSVYSNSADILLNGKKVGTGRYSDKLHAGKYTVKIIPDENHEPSNFNVTLAPGDKKVYYADPEGIYQEFDLHAIPDSLKDVQVFVDGELKGTAPIYISLRLGDHKLLLKHENYRSESRNLSLSKDKKEELTVKMTGFEEILAFRNTLHDYQNYSLYAAGVTAAGAVALHLINNSVYTDYKNALSASSASNLRNKVNNYRSVTNTAIGIMSACVLSTAIFWAWQKLL